MKMINLKLINTFILLSIGIFLTQGCKKDDTSSGTVTDADGNVYHTVQIGNQVWMVENLRTTKYNDNSPITPVSDNAVWGTLTTEAYCWYNNDEATYKETYGALYNWYAVNTGKLCPAGWKVPSDADWSLLITTLGGDSTTVGGKLKETGTMHWVSPNTGADNSSGFTALPGGSHYTNGGFYLNGKYGWYWSTDESSATKAWHEYFQYNSSAIFRIAGSKSDGFSVRCIKK